MNRRTCFFGISGSLWRESYNSAARAQRLTGYACIAFGILLLMVGINAVVSFIRPGGLLGGILS